MGIDDLVVTPGAVSVPEPVSTPGAAPTPASAPAPNPGRGESGLGRIASLDWARGWMLVVSVTVNSFLTMPAWFDHAPWAGVHPLDLVFPIFVTLSGCGLAFANARRVQVKPLVKRVLILLVAGLLYNAITNWSFNLSTWRVYGVLQLYAVIVVIVGLLHLVTRKWWGWLIITTVIALAHSALLILWATTCPDGVLTRTCNPSGPIDTALFTTQHIYVQGTLGHDPEGLVSIFGALVSASAGATLGHLLLAIRRRRIANGDGPSTAIKAMLLTALGFLAMAGLCYYVLPLPLDVHLPIMKRLWTAPFALTVAAGVALLLLLGHLLLDRAQLSRALTFSSYPLIALGRNSLFTYFGSHVVMSVLVRPFAGPGSSVADQVTAVLAYLGPPQLLWTLGALIVWLGLACILHRFKIYLRP